MENTIKLIVIIILLFASTQVFNHVNAWLGIGLFIAIILLVINYFNKIFK